MRRLVASLAIVALLAPLSLRAQEHGGVYSSGDFDPLDRGQDRGPKPPQPIARKAFDDAVGKMFALADSNRDGTVTVAELQALIAVHRERAIQDRFASVDTDHNKAISLSEFSQWQRSLGSLSLSEADAGGGIGIVAEEIRYQPGRGADDEAIARLIQPLSSTVIAAANTNYDAGASLAEVVAYEGKRFEAVDADKDGWLTADELRTGRGGAPASGPRPNS